MSKNLYKVIFDYLLLTVGTFLLAAGLLLFLEPNTIAPGGVTGLAIVIKKLSGIEIYVTNILINVPLFIAGVYVLGRSFGVKTAYGTAVLSVFLWLFSRDDVSYMATNDVLLASIFGGIMVGVGIGLVFRGGGTTGGTDLGGAILNKLFPGFSIAKMMMILDLFVILAAGVVDQRIETSLYSMIGLYVLVKVADFIVEGLDYSKSFHIITDHPQEISDVIIEKLERGVTSLYGKGMYTGKDKQVLLVVVNRAQVSKLKDIVMEVDPRAFIMVSTTHEVLGEGFREIVNP